MQFVQSPYWQSRNKKPIDSIVIHTTVGTYDGTISYFKKNDREVSAHYVTSLDGEITQMVKEDLGANHAGIISNPKTKVYKGFNPNWNTIGIENADNGDPAGADRSKQLPALAKLVSEICARYSIPIDKDHICGHRELYDKKTCPGNIDVDEVIRLAKGGSINPMDPFKEKGIAALDKYRGERKQGPEGNYESYVAAVIGSDKTIEGVEAAVLDRDSKIFTLTNQLNAANGTIDVRDQAVTSLKAQLQTAVDKYTELASKPPVLNPTPIFKNPVAAFFYKLALWAEE